MPGTTILTESVTKGTITDNYGYYTLTGIPKGAFELTVSYIGFNPGKKQVTIEPGKTMVGDFILKAGIELSEVVIPGQLVGQSKL